MRGCCSEQLQISLKKPWRLEGSAELKELST